MSGSQWVTIPLWSFGSLKPFLYDSVYSCHLILISSASVRSLLFLSFIVPILAWNCPLMSPVFLRKSLVFPVHCFPLFLCIAYWIRLSYHSLIFSRILHSFGFIFSFLPYFPLLFFPQLCKASSDNHFAFLRFFFGGWFWSLPPIQCYKPPPKVLQVLSRLSPWI